MKRKALAFMMTICMLVLLVSNTVYATENLSQLGEVGEDIIVPSDNESIIGTESNQDIMLLSSSGLNTAVKNRILSFKSKYPEGKNWDPSGAGWRGLAWECYGFAITMAGLVFKDYPTNAHLRNTGNGKTVEGWTCYYVDSSNYNSLVVEPGDIIDCPTSSEWNHTAMVLSVDNGVITCVQANNGGNNLVYWTKCFNYNSNNSTLKKIYTNYSSYITGKMASKYMRLWKPSDKVKIDATGYSETPVTSTLKITGASYPADINYGSSWTCKGTISSNYTINQVSGYILGNDNSTIIYSKTVNPNSTSYVLQNSDVDKALLFNKLSGGTYYYKITARDSSGKNLTLINTKFTIVGQCSFSGQVTNPANGAIVYTPQINVHATATDNYEISYFKIKVSGDGGSNAQEKTVSAAKSGSAYICDCNIDLAANGKYTVAVSAECKDGKTHTVGSTTFTYERHDCGFALGSLRPEISFSDESSIMHVLFRACDYYGINNYNILKLRT